MPECRYPRKTRKDRFFIDAIKLLQPERLLEIGPGNNPCFTGDNVFYYDCRSAEELTQFYNNRNIPCPNVPKTIHYLTKDGPLGDIGQKFDVVFSSHNIEHQIDLIKHFKEVSGILNENGIFVLIVPNMRYTLDYYKPASSLAEVVAQYSQYPNATAHSTYKILLRMFSTHNDCARHWNGEHGDKVTNDECIVPSLQEIERNKGGYIDTHAWFFTDDSFFDLFHRLHALNYIDLCLFRLYNTPKNTNSFHAIFVKKSQTATTSS